jgi:lysophospholipase L1-like esterase
MVKLKPVPKGQQHSYQHRNGTKISSITRFCMVAAFSGLVVVGFLVRSKKFVSSFVGGSSSTLSSLTSGPAYQVVRVRKSNNMSTSATMISTSNYNGDSSTPPQKPKHSIFCYGDSLTAGTSGRFEFPYAVHLQGELQSLAQVDWLGLPGWTADSMWRERWDPTVGLEAALTKRLQRQQDEKLPPYSLVILLAGTNDMGYGYKADEIFDNLVKLHELCISKGVLRTLAIGIPPSAYQSSVGKAAELAAAVNKHLRQYSQQHEDRTAFMEFPFAYEQNGANWNADGLHFSQQGYQLLGESLAPVVGRILQETPTPEGGRSLEEGRSNK